MWSTCFDSLLAFIALMSELCLQFQLQQNKKVQVQFFNFLKICYYLCFSFNALQGPSSPACSHCSSSCSSLVNSPKLKNSTSHRHHRHDRNASAFRLLGCSQEDSFRLVTETAVHQTQCDPNSVSDHSLRKKSLPEIISVPHEDVPKIRYL